MGDTAQSYIAERFIASIWNGGDFDGYVLLLTDPTGLAKYNTTLSIYGGHNEYYHQSAIVNHETIVVSVDEDDLFHLWIL